LIARQKGSLKCGKKHSGCVIGEDGEGNPRLLPVQGSSQWNPSELSNEEREAILAKVRQQMAKKGE
jgi:hypothetical protein